MSEPILLSTDIGSDVDDALSLLVMLNHPGINLEAVYTVNGDIQSRCYIAKRMIDLAGKNIAVGQGLSNPLGALTLPYSFFERHLVDDAYLDEEKSKFYRTECFKPLESIGVIADGIKHMARQLLEKPHVVFSIAPMTMIAILLQDYPEAAANISKLFIMGCRTDGNMEHNLRYDSLAAQKVLESNIPLVIVPGNICNRLHVKGRDFFGMKSPAGEYTSSMLKAFIGAKIVSECRMQNITELIKKADISPDVFQNMSDMEKLRLHEKLVSFKRQFLAGFREKIAYLARDNFLDELQQLIEILRRNYRYGNGLASILEMLLNMDVSVADVYIPYCFLHPEKLVTERMNVHCDLEGYTYTEDGDRHEVVTDLDFAHFRKFLETYLI